MKKKNFKKFINYKIGTKLGLCFGLLLTIAACSSLYAISNLNKAGNLSEELFKGPYEITNESMGIRKDIVSIGQNISFGILSDSIEQYEGSINENFKIIEERIGRMYANPMIDDSLKELMKNIVDSVTVLYQEYQTIYNVIGQGDLEKAKEMTISEDGSYIQAYKKCGENSVLLYDEAHGKSIAFDKSVKATVSKSLITSIVITLVNTVIGIFACLYLVRNINQPIEEIEEAANKMANGDFDIAITYESEDELGNLSNSMSEVSIKTKEVIEDTVRILEEVSSGNFDVKPNAEYIGVFENIEKSIIKITNDLSETMLQINMASEEVESASEQVATGSQMLSQGATEQASAIEELSATISEIYEKVKETSKNASEANTLALAAGTEVSEGNEQMREMVKAMSEISFTANEISRIIKTIDDIAFQTNILALNAAVEAARAGEAGKGFAVVAEEVRNLAGKSAEAAKNTSTLIENSLRAVDNGMQIVDKTALSLNKIITTTNDTIVVVDDIVVASEEQATSIAQVRLGAQQISDVIQTNSATSEESAAASQELSGQAQMLKSLINDFKLKRSNSYAEAISFDAEMLIKNI